MADEYIRGAVVEIFGEDIRDRTGNPADPATVKVIVTDPAGTSTPYTYALAEVIKDSPYNYRYNLATAGVSDAQLGYWVATWITTGTPAIAKKIVFLLKSETTR